MRLLRCEIQNFGGLSNFSRTFSPGLTVIEEKNGFGKTTLAEFLRAMFYGFQNSKAGRERRRQYQPWQGGIYGGVIEFEHNAVRYRVERTFGETPKSDRFALYNIATGQRSTDFSEKLGEELFHLDADSYERSAYLSQLTEITEFHTDSIQAKLNDLVSDTGDVNHFEKALETLEKKRRSISGRSARAVMNDIQSRLDALPTIPESNHERNQLLQDIERRSDEIAQAEQDVGDKQEELKTIRQRMRQAAEAAARKAIRDNCLRMESECAQLRRELDDMGPQVRQFERGYPSDDEITFCQGKFRDYLAAQSAFDASALSDTEEEQLAQSAEFFSSGMPSEDEWTEKQQLLTRLQTLREENTRAELQTQTTADTASGHAADRLVTPLFLLGLLAVAAGTVLLVTRPDVHYGTAALVGGALLLIGAAYLHILRMVRSVQAGQNTAIRTRDPDYERRQTEIRQLEHSLTEFTARYALNHSDPVASMTELRMRYEPYQDLIHKRERVQKRREELSARSQTLEQEIRNFLELYSIPPITQWKPEQGGELLAALRHSRQTWQDLTNRLETREKELERYREEHQAELADALEDDSELPSMEELHEAEERLNGERGEIPLLRERISALQRENQDCQRRADEIPLQQDERRALEEQKNVEQHKSLLLDETMRFLREAQERLSGQYLETVRHGFEQYAARLIDPDKTRVAVGGRLEVSVERSGILRQTTSFSAGETDLVLLCMRLALVDALFRDSQPFLVLDDPFINLDDVHTRKALDALADLSRDHQIIYLVCNSSRVRHGK